MSQATAEATAAGLRGAAAGLLTAALTLASHGVGGGAILAGAATVQLLVVAAVIGGVAASVSRADDLRVMVCLLGAGQVFGHVVLAAGGHAHAAPPAAAMVSAHAVAVVVGGLLISAGARLCRVLSRVLRVVGRPNPPLASVSRLSARTADQPMRSTLLISCSMSYRGPPAGACC
ncbi:hypothetical protein [Mycolicibacterium austroafricanum]|uniref:hypothetical protein n=1 Tax=Mycolicibacterium austroafricanum TaxID=39687 RepID=UPI001CA37813|nr:hypothetical protein [Mycolicibacterium austroafricanum]QZT62642.1 hypothetical protein JN085_27965 [Mycolicibacterium austroafricanum]